MFELVSRYVSYLGALVSISLVFLAFALDVTAANRSPVHMLPIRGIMNGAIILFIASMLVIAY